ncbi:putative ethanolamine transporter [Escherichia coli]|uniref:Putative ethanolamine transporter n=1 Tax=Escherichia coli TaxID=562 RepID=A0A484WYW4_ECOLX|nr:putative ethanolamine transporter [Escherichia coli]
MTALAPVLAHVLGPVIIPVYEMLGANPSMFAGTLLACDMAASSSPKSWRAVT